eukprot:270461-Pyramimonas_sp.AAC.1
MGFPSSPQLRTGGQMALSLWRAGDSSVPEEVIEFFRAEPNPTDLPWSLARRIADPAEAHGVPLPRAPKWQAAFTDIFQRA